MRIEQVCPIWGTPASVTDLEKHPEQLVKSHRAGGAYKVTSLEIAAIQVLDVDTKVKLTNWIVDQNRFGVEQANITKDIIEQCKQDREAAVFDRADKLIQFLSHKTKRVGGRVSFLEHATNEFSHDQAGGDITGFFKKHRGYEHYLQMLAWTGSRDLDELEFFIDYLGNQGWINYNEGLHISVVAPKGYAHLGELSGANPLSDQCFVAMWFDESMKTAYDEGIEPAIRDSGYKPLRIDKKEHANKIDDEIIAEIKRSRFVVADFTSQPNKPRGGVYYEAGFAQGLNIPVIWSCRKDLIKQVHFDTRQFNHIVWEEPADLRSQLQNRIGAVIGDGPYKRKA